MKVVFAPDSFKGTLAASDAARALAAGFTDAMPGSVTVLRPMADGGEGTLDALAGAMGSKRYQDRVSGPDGRVVEASWLALDDGATAVIELAETSGLTLMRDLSPLDAHTLGLGEAISVALDSGAKRIMVALGGSASTDGGAGALIALGARFLDSHGFPVPLGARGLARIERADLSQLRDLPSGGVTVLSDVTSPLTGRDGAANVYGPQKGATPDLVEAMDAALVRYAEALNATRPTVYADAPGAGAAGGTGFGLAVWGARVTSGARAIADAIGLEEALVGADLVVTGEGRYDGQTATGKVVSEVMRLAQSADVPVALAAGAVEADIRGFAGAASLTSLAGGVEKAMSNPARWLREAGAALATHTAT